MVISDAGIKILFILALVSAAVESVSAVPRAGAETIGTPRAKGTNSEKSSSTASAYVFDREYEREMRMNDPRYLDLDRGEFVGNLPPGDLSFAPTESDSRVRNGRGMVAIPVPADRWNATADEIVSEVSKTAPEK